MLACGSTVGHAFVNLYYIHEAAKIQVLAMQAAAVAGSGGLKDIAGVDGPAFDRMRNGSNSATQAEGVFSMYKRRVDRAFPGYAE